MTPSIVPALSFGLKILVLIGIALYGVFAIILVRQEQLMAKVLEEKFEPILRILVVIHLLAALFVFAAAFFLL